MSYAASALLAPPASAAARQPVAPPSLAYGIDLNRRADDLFHVTLRVTGLGPGYSRETELHTDRGRPHQDVPDGSQVVVAAGLWPRLPASG